MEKTSEKVNNAVWLYRLIQTLEGLRDNAEERLNLTVAELNDKGLVEYMRKTSLAERE